MVLTAYIALSPVTGLSCHRRQRSCLRQLDASVGASGPHDFAVRFGAIRPHECADAATSIASNPASVTIAIRPSEGSDGESSKFDLPDARSEIFLQRGLDRKNCTTVQNSLSGKSVAVVPAKAGTHNHRCWLLESRLASVLVRGAAAYGSRRSPGRQLIRHGTPAPITSPPLAHMNIDVEIDLGDALLRRLVRGAFMPAPVAGAGISDVGQPQTPPLRQRA